MGELKLDRQTLFRGLLQEEFKQRSARNLRYSLRAFARDIDVDSSTLSQVLSSRRDASDEMIDHVSRVLNLPLELVLNTLKEVDFDRVAAKDFDLISEWYFFAILDLTLLKNFVSDIDWIAKKLSLPKAVVKSAIDKLLQFDYLTIANGSLKKTAKQFTNDLGRKTTEAKKEYQRQMIKLALDAIDNCEPTRKDITSITIAANPAKLEIAREKIKLFRRELCALLEDGQAEDVYHLTVQLYPATIEEKNDE